MQWLKTRHGYVGATLARFMCGSIASRLGDATFRADFDALADVIGSDGAHTVLRGNCQLASRFTPENVAHLKVIGAHVRDLGLDVGDTLRTIVSNSIPMMKKLGLLNDKLLTLDKAQVVAFAQSCKGDAHAKRDVVANAL